MDRRPVFVFGQLPRRNSLILLLKLDYPLSEDFDSMGHNMVYTFVHNCPAVSMHGILSDGFIRPSSWRDQKDGDHLPSLGFYCRCCYPGHGHHNDGRIDKSITDTLPAELQCALHIARESGRQYFVAGEWYNRGVVKSGGLPVMLWLATSSM